MVYSEQHVRNILQGIGVEIKAETDVRYNCLCPFHHNTNTPAFSIDKQRGVWICFNDACGKSGNLEQLIMEVTERSEPEAMRYIATRSSFAGNSLSDILDDAFTSEPEWPVFPQQVVDQLVENFWNNTKAQAYMYGRGFDEETLRYFEIGYSPKMGGEVVYPVHNPKGDTCVGVVGRGVDRKFFDNSKNLPKKRVLYNLNNARKESSKVVVVEAGFDAQRIHQAGFPNVVATLGLPVTEEQIGLMERNFTTVIVFTDNDDAGMAARHKIMNKTRQCAVLHASCDYGTLYPEEGENIPADKESKRPKDAGDLSLTQIEMMINNAKTSYETGVA